MADAGSATDRRSDSSCLIAPRSLVPPSPVRRPESGSGSPRLGAVGGLIPARPSRARRRGISGPLRVRGIIPPAAKCPYHADFSWGGPDPESLPHLLHLVFENREEAAAKGRAAAAEKQER